MNAKEQADFKARADIIKALAHPTRLWIVDKLADGEHCVCEFYNRLDIDFSTISKHLAVLRRAGIIESEKRGKQVYYTLRVPCILKFIGCVEAVLEKNSADCACLTAN